VRSGGTRVHDVHGEVVVEPALAAAGRCAHRSELDDAADLVAIVRAHGDRLDAAGFAELVAAGDVARGRQHLDDVAFTGPRRRG
jgi:hypothetical protein